MTSEEKQDRIDKYLLGEADDNSRRELEEESTRDEELLKGLEDTKVAMAAIELAEDRALKARLQDLESSLAKENSDQKAKVVGLQPRRTSTLRYLAYAASLLLVLAVGWWALSPGSSPSPQQLAMANFEAYPNIAYQLERSGTEEASPEELAFVAYEDGDYARAATRFEALEDTPTNRFYRAQSELAQENFTEATTLFLELSQRGDFALAAESEYFHAIALLGSGAQEEAAQLLSSIAGNASHPMTKEATALLAKLD
jgi:hypothetical protein